jgi:hypothetical protein
MSQDETVLVEKAKNKSAKDVIKERTISKLIVKRDLLFPSFDCRLFPD